MAQVEKLGLFLAQLMEQKKISNRELARLADVSEGAIRNLLKVGDDPRAKAPDALTLSKAGIALGVDPLVFFRLAGYIPPSSGQHSTTPETSEIATCTDCGAEEGELHELGCDMERCPFCGGQLITCDCPYKQLGLFNRKRYGRETDHLPRAIYEDGLTDTQEAAWIKILKRKGRIPFVVYPNICARCGALWPEFFRVPDEEWEHYIEPAMRGKILCRSCYDAIKQLIDVHRE